jgi:steroid delta-isomerase-like uncharacterized protein
MSLDANKELIRRFHQTVMVERQLEQVAQFMRDPLTDHDSTGQPETLEHVRQSFDAYFKAFPDLQATIDDVTGENDLVTCRLTLSGTHQGEFMGHTATGKPISVSSIFAFRVAGGKIVERWEWVDRMGMRNQLGIQN